jgi:hypothetical protein
MAQITPQNVMIRLGVIALVFIGIVAYYFYKYGLNFSFAGNQRTLIAVALGLFIGLIVSLFKFKDQLF